MSSRALKIDFDTDELKVVCVNSPLASYLFVFLLNKKLKLHLCRSAKDMGEADKNVSYAVYEYRCDVLQNTWRVIENRCDSSHEQTHDSLFSRMAQRSLLFPRLKQQIFLFALMSLVPRVLIKLNLSAKLCLALCFQKINPLLSVNYILKC